MNRITCITMLTLLTGTWSTASQPMEKTEILQLFDQLCQRPAPGWIEQGQIEAIHRSSDFISGEVTETREKVVTDGAHFTWNLHVMTYKNNASSYAQDEFLKWNQDRTFIWDGLSYTLYFTPGNHAIVHEDPTSLPVRVTGPLTAGYVPWGQGVFAYSHLSQARFSGEQVQDQGGLRIHLTVQPPDRPTLQFVLNPDKDYAVESYTLVKSQDSKIIQRYGNFTLWQGRWIPMNILIDRYENNRLRSSNSWEIVSLENDLPDKNLFVASLKEGALVERHSSFLDKPVFYRHSKGHDIESLLVERFVSALNNNAKNCGTAAIGHVLSTFDMTASGTELASLVDPLSGETLLYEIKQFIEHKGLSSLAVKTDIKGLNRYKDSQIILYFPRKQHFVVLDRIDNEAVWLIDLDRQTFYHNMDFTVFDQAWSGIALVVSTEPLVPNRTDVPVPEQVLKNISGSADYSCSDLIQEYDVAFCPTMTNNICGGRYIMWYDRYGCEIDTNGGYCDGTGVVGSIYSACMEDPSDPGQCTTTGDYASRYLRACQP